MCNRTTNLPSDPETFGLHRFPKRLLHTGSAAFLKGATVKEIPLTQGKIALVDDTDYEWLLKYTWCANRAHHTFYAVTTIKRDGHLVTERMHRLIMGFPPCKIDHRNRNGLDNQRGNLRLASDRQNTLNRAGYGISKFKGVHIIRGKYYSAEIRGLDVRFYLGCFGTAEEAAKAYDVAAELLHREFAYLNFPDIPRTFSNPHLDCVRCFAATQPQSPPLIAYKPKLEE